MSAYTVLVAAASPLPACVIAERMGADLCDVYVELVSLEACGAARIISECKDAWTYCRWEAI
jgi:hypothetical protein